MYDEIERQITGNIMVTRQFDDSGNEIAPSYEWQGGDIVGISESLLVDLDERYAHLDGDIVTFGPYRLEIIARFPDPPSIGIVLAKRIYD